MCVLWLQLNQAAAMMNMQAAASGGINQSGGVGSMGGPNLPDSLMGPPMPGGTGGGAMGGSGAAAGTSNLVRQSGQGSGGSAPELREHVYNKNNNQMMATAVQSHHIMNQQSATLAAGKYLNQHYLYLPSD